MNLKRLFKDSALYTAMNVLSKGISIILLPIYTYFLSPAQFGLVDYFAAIGAIVAVTISLEVSQAIVRFLPDLKKNNADTSPLISASLFSLILSFSVFVVPVLIFAERISFGLFDTYDYSHLVRLSACLYCLHGFVHIFNSILVALLKSKKSIGFSLINTVFNASATYLLLVNTELRVEALLLGQMIGAAASLICYYPVVLGSVNFTFERSALNQMYKFSLPLIPSSVGVILAMFTDRLMIKEFLDLESLGVYGIALRVASIMTLITTGFRTALTPIIYSSHEARDTKPKIIRLFYLYLLMAFFILCGVLFFQEMIVLYLSSKEYMGATEVVGILCTTIFISNCYIFFPGLSLAQKTASISIVNVLGMIVNVVLNFVFIPIYGILGAATATLISALFTFVVHFTLSQRHYALPITSSRLLTTLMVLLISVFTLQKVL